MLLLLFLVQGRNHGVAAKAFAFAPTKWACMFTQPDHNEMLPSHPVFLSCGLAYRLGVKKRVQHLSLRFIERNPFKHRHLGSPAQRLIIKLQRETSLRVLKFLYKLKLMHSPAS